MKLKMPDAGTRKAIYGVLVAVILLATGYGYITEDKTVLWINLAAALTMGGLAIPNTRDPGADVG